MRRSREQWVQIVEQFERSGQSHEAFCTQQRLNVGSLRGWHYRLRSGSRLGRVARSATRLLPVRMLAQIETWIAQQPPMHLPEGPMGAALRYIHNQWKPLTVFMSDSAIPIHNNTSESALRIVALARKNSLFFGHEQAARNFSVLYTESVARAVERALRLDAGVEKKDIADGGCFLPDHRVFEQRIKDSPVLLDLDRRLHADEIENSKSRGSNSERRCRVGAPQRDG